MPEANNNFDKELELEENKVENDEGEYPLPPENVYSYTETRSCSDIYRMLHNELCRTPNFQRYDVWDMPQKTRFLDSLLKRLPIPSLCFSVDANDSYMVIDGRQRTGVIEEFLSEENSELRLSLLDDVDTRLSGKTLGEIQNDNPEVYRAIRNLTIPINVIKCDYTRDDNLNYIYKIFQRLNTGGLKLSNQEIRNCVYYGSFVKLINECNENKNWIEWVEKLAHDKRMKGPERVLLFFCMYYSIEEYENKLSSFLSTFLLKHKNEPDEWINKQRELFIKTIGIAKRISLKSIRNVYIDAILYGIGKNIDNCSKKTNIELQKLYENLLADNAFLPEKLRDGTSNKNRLLERYNAAKRIFGK